MCASALYCANALLPAKQLQLLRGAAAGASLAGYAEVSHQWDLRTRRLASGCGGERVLRRCSAALAVFASECLTASARFFIETYPLRVLRYVSKSPQSSPDGGSRPPPSRRRRLSKTWEDAVRRRAFKRTRGLRRAGQLHSAPQLRKRRSPGSPRQRAHSRTPSVVPRAAHSRTAAAVPHTGRHPGTTQRWRPCPAWRVWCPTSRLFYC